VINDDVAHLGGGGAITVESWKIYLYSSSAFSARSHHMYSLVLHYKLEQFGHGI